MNNGIFILNKEILRTLTIKEYISTFLGKEIRPDQRKLDDRREFKFEQNVLENFSDSATCLLGQGNKVLSVLKKQSSAVPSLSNIN
jgi:exosome complex RNA-binding protein Rrp42 (RNase PH superfamily)